MILRKELLKITGSKSTAIILNQFIYWAGKGSKGKWIYKSQQELSDELNISRPTLRKHINKLIEAGLLHQRNNEKYKWDHTYQYAVDFDQICLMLMSEGYDMEDENMVTYIAKQKALGSPIEGKKVSNRMEKSFQSEGKKFPNNTRDYNSKDYNSEKNPDSTNQSSFEERIEILKKETKKKSSQRLDQKLGPVRMYRYYVAMCSENNILASSEPSSKELGMLKGLRKTLEDVNVSYKEYLQYAFTNWRQLRGVICWEDSVKSRLKEKPNFLDLIYSKMDILSTMKQSNEALQPKEALTIDTLPKDHPNYDRLKLLIEQGIPVTL